MSIEKNVQIVKNFLAALGRRDKQGLLALSAEDIEWIIPGEDWPLAGTHRGHAGLENLLQKANETVETSYPEPPEFIAQGDRVLVVGFATGRIKATNRTFEDHWVFAITVRNGKLTNVREYIDTQALARASEMPRAPGPDPSTPIPHETIRKVNIKALVTVAMRVCGDLEQVPSGGR
jgi:ketosteroid isomerase-like protein